MKAKVNKKWWQFWLPGELELEADSVHHAINLTTPNARDAINNSAIDVSRQLDDQSAAIEADEAEPWYGGDAVEDEDSSVVTAEPPVVYANRGNARMEERKQAREKMQ